jgi:hypothetical protein
LRQLLDSGVSWLALVDSNVAADRAAVPGALFENLGTRLQAAEEIES